MLVAPVPGKQVGEVSFMAGQADKDIFKPCPGFYAGRLARGEQRVDDGGADGAIVVPAEQEVLPVQGKRPDGILHEVAVDAEASVVHIAAQSGKKRQRKADRLPDAAEKLIHMDGFAGRGCRRVCRRLKD